MRESRGSIHWPNDGTSSLRSLGQVRIKLIKAPIETVYQMEDTLIIKGRERQCKTQWNHKKGHRYLNSIHYGITATQRLNSIASSMQQNLRVLSHADQCACSSTSHWSLSNLSGQENDAGVLVSYQEHCWWATRGRKYRATLTKSWCDFGRITSRLFTISFSHWKHIQDCSNNLRLLWMNLKPSHSAQNTPAPESSITNGV